MPGCVAGERDDERERFGDERVRLSGCDPDPRGGVAQQSGLVRVKAAHPVTHRVTEPLAQQELGVGLQPCRHESERDQWPDVRGGSDVGEAFGDRSGHPHLQVRVLGEELLRGADPHPPIAVRAGQQRLRCRVRVEQPHVLDTNTVLDDEVLPDDGHRPITARAAANSAANASGAKCTYLAVVSGEA